MSTGSEDEGQSASPRVAVGNGVDPSSGKASKGELLSIQCLRGLTWESVRAAETGLGVCVL